MQNKYNNLKILTLIDDIAIYNSLIENLKTYPNLEVLPDITYIEGIIETLEINSNISHLIIYYETFAKSNLTSYEILQFLLNIKKKILDSNISTDIIILLNKENLELQEKLQLIDINKIFITSNITHTFIYNILTNNNTSCFNYINKEDDLINKLVNLDSATLNTYSNTNNFSLNSLNNFFATLTTPFSNLLKNYNRFNNNLNNKFTNVYKFKDLKKEYNRLSQEREKKTENYKNNKNNKNEKNTQIINKNNKNYEIKIGTNEERTTMEIYNKNLNEKIILNEDTEYYSNNLHINNFTNNDLMNLPLSNLIQKYKKIEIILSDKEDI